MSPLIESLGGAHGFGLFAASGGTPIVGAYDALATVTVPSGGSSSITFSGIPGAYTHLQLRSFSGTTGAGDIFLRINGDTSSNYYSHLLYGTGSSANAYSTSGTASYWMVGNSYGTANAFGAAITDILDYANINKNKTLRALYGYDTNGAGQLNFGSSLWNSTSAINSLTIYPQSGNLIQYSSFALYGVK